MRLFACTRATGSLEERPCESVARRAQFDLEPSGSKSFEQSLGLRRVERVEAFGEPAVDGREQIARLGTIPAPARAA